MPFIKCHDLDVHLDETFLIPPVTIMLLSIGKDEKIAETQVRNPAYIAWKKMDHYVVAYVTATLSNEVLYTIYDDMYAKELWEMLSENYSQVFEVLVVQIETSQSSQAIKEDYKLCNSLAAIESPISDKEQP